MTWYLVQNSRLSHEKVELAELEGSVDWLRVTKWHINSDFAMCLDFEVSLGHSKFSLQMIYPTVFPDAPPMIYTADRSRISKHQYGAEGELCLEFRPDNWISSVTGAEMVASCHRLLAEENPESGNQIFARSAHVASLGRDFRSERLRFLATKADVAAINRIAGYKAEAVTLDCRFSGSDLIASIVTVGDTATPIWESDLVMPKGGRSEKGLVVRTPKEAKLGNITPEALRKHLCKLELDELCVSLLDVDPDAHLLLGDGSKWELFWIYGTADSKKIMRYKTLPVPIRTQRLPDGFENLANRKIGIAGCGSLGSKIAASLCRAGVGSILLVDEDIFFADNIVRNELSLRDTGAHKAVALKNRLLEINPQCNVTALRMKLGGQESASAMTAALEAFGSCDLIVDGTGEPVAFNMLASVSTRKSKPMVWAEVFGGGIGGMIARARPNIDPVPLSVRSQIEVWCNDQDVEWFRPDNQERYTGQNDEGLPLIADDAEVGVIASYATRFATDILARPDSSIFPQSVYIIGLSSEWLFNEPFDTRPVQLLPNGEWGEKTDDLTPEEKLKILEEHLPSNKEDSGATASSQ